MNRRTFARVALALPALFGLGSCSTLFEDSEGLTQVDDLVGRVERVHVEAELAQERMHEALELLQRMSSMKFEGDPVTIYDAYAEAIDKSEKQTQRLRSSLDPMRSTAESVFAQWNRDLDSFTSRKMRKRSQARLEETQARYEAIVAAVGPAHTALEMFNLKLKDHATFLGNDFNASSVSMIQADVRVLSNRRTQIDKRLQACLTAAEEYIRSASLPGTINVSDDETTTRGEL